MTRYAHESFYFLCRSGELEPSLMEHVRSAGENADYDDFSHTTTDVATHHTDSPHDAPVEARSYDAESARVLYEDISLPVNAVQQSFVQSLVSENLTRALRGRSSSSSGLANGVQRGEP